MMHKLLARLKEEFKVSNVKFDWKANDDFEKSAWGSFCGHRYIIFRWALALYVFVALVLSIVVTGKYGWIFALTSISYLAVTIYFIYAAILVSYRHLLKSHVTRQQATLNSGTTVAELSTNSSKNESTRLCFKVHWFLYNLAMNSCAFVFLAFWLVLIAPTGKLRSQPPLRTFLVIDRHGINFVLLIIDFWMNRIPIRILHFVYPSIFIGLYFVYNAVYWSITKKLIYGEIFNYGSRAGLATGLILGSILFLTPLIQFALFFAYLLKERLVFKHKADANKNIDVLSHVTNVEECEVQSIL